MADLARYITPTQLFPLAVLAAISCFVGYYWYVQVPRSGTLEWIALRERNERPFTFTLPFHRLERKDALPMLLLTVLYAFTAFFSLGSLSAPQSALNLGSGESVTWEFQEEMYVSKLWYYSGLGTGEYNVEISSDGSHWSTLWQRTDEEGEVTGYYWADAEGYSPSYAMTQDYADLFKWLEIEPENPQYVRYLRITGKADRNQLLELAELVLFDEDGQPIPIGDSTNPLFDEADTVPDSPSWYNSSYFDEIYHPRTAYEHVRGIYPYEISHPPLGKLIISLGIRLFGMTPFGWRFMGALFGVAMVPLLYVFLKNFFGKTVVAACGAALFAFDFMHLTQTRLATIDTYAVFFILAMYFFLYRYLALPDGANFARGAPWLLLSGLMWGIGAASKWTVIYGGVGLAVLYFMGLWGRWRRWSTEPSAQRFSPWLIKTLLFSVLCFVILPFFIYTLSYWPYAIARGNEGGLGEMLLEILRFPTDQLPRLLSWLFVPGENGERGAFPFQSTSENIVDIMLSNANYMLTYHSGVDSYHPYSSRWYQWIIDARPILYYQEYLDGGYKVAFAAFNNPVVCWAGLLSVISAAIQMVRRRCARAVFIVVGYLSQLLPWLLISRTTFEYHYFPCLIFLVMAICYLMDGLVERKAQNWRVPVYGLTCGAVGAYALFYPVLVGLTIPTWFASGVLKWLPSWPF